MTKVFSLIIFYVFTITSCLSQGFAVAGAALYGSEIETVGINFRSYLLINENLCFGPEFTRFTTTKRIVGNEKEDIDLIELNFNMHYVSEVGRKFGAYPLIGINWAHETEGDFEKSAFGINLGGGIHYFGGRWLPFAEYIYLTGDLSEHSFMIGTYFIIKDVKKESHPGG